MRKLILLLMLLMAFVCFGVSCEPTGGTDWNTAQATGSADNSDYTGSVESTESTEGTTATEESAESTEATTDGDPSDDWTGYY